MEAREIPSVIPADAGIQKKATGFRVKPGMTGFMGKGGVCPHDG
jgi:hypothetical protein